LRAAEQLFAERGFENVSIREIAAAAAVAHPAIYYYWGSKRGLLAAVLESNQRRMRATAIADPDVRVMILDLARENLAGSRDYLLTVVRAFLDGMAPADWPGGFPAIEAIVDGLLRESRREEREIREVVLAAVALLMGYVLIEDQLLEIVGLPASARDGARETLVRSIENVIGRVLPQQADDER